MPIFVSPHFSILMDHATGQSSDKQNVLLPRTGTVLLWVSNIIPPHEKR